LKVRYTLRAFAERERIFDYREARNPSAARSVLGLIKQRIEGLGERPRKGAPYQQTRHLYALDYAL
jgi:plasmid stabilization system protein ParE